jgi:hypothetical protein
MMAYQALEGILKLEKVTSRKVTYLSPSNYFMLNQGLFSNVVDPIQEHGNLQKNFKPTLFSAFQKFFVPFFPLFCCPFKEL